MNKNWEDIYENLSLELKREIAENYFSEKLYLEEAWNSFKELVDEFRIKQKKVFNDAWKIYFILKNGDLIEDFEKITGFPLKEVISQSKRLYKKIYDLPEDELKKKLFSQELSPFALTQKGRFKKIFFNVYKHLFKNLKDYLEDYNKMERLYNALKEDTERFHQNFDMSYILNFFNKLELSESEEDLGGIEDREKVWEEITEQLKIKIPEEFIKDFKKYKMIPETSKVYSKLSKLVKKVLERHPERIKEITSLVY